MEVRVRNRTPSPIVEIFPSAYARERLILLTSSLQQVCQHMPNFAVGWNNKLKDEILLKANW